MELKEFLKMMEQSFLWMNPVTGLLLEVGIVYGIFDQSY